MSVAQALSPSLPHPHWFSRFSFSLLPSSFRTLTISRLLSSSLLRARARSHTQFATRKYHLGAPARLRLMAGAGACAPALRRLQQMVERIRMAL